MGREYKICSFEYAPPEEGFDEFVSGEGGVRASVKELLRRLEPFSREEFGRRRLRIRNVLNENDLISFPPGRSPHDGIDPLPLVIAPDEWRMLEAGIAQRARLFDRLAADLYGEQTLWKRGILPPVLLHGNPDFLQVVWQVKLPHDIHVHLMGCDVVRGGDGCFYAASDHLQVPEGLGRALENRLAVGRAFPELFRDLHAERLAGFFKKWLECLGSLRSEEDPRIVLLASDPENSRRNEDAVLARYLGLQLVENDDLAVRNLQVHLKTLTGLKRIDTIFRRVDDGMCDPLELRIDSGEGAVGLISSVRSGSVAIANALGAAALETPLWKPFLPQLCVELLGEEQLLKDLPSVWLGESSRTQEVFDAPEKWNFRQIFKDTARREYRAMTATGRLALLHQIERNPENWVAEARFGHSTAPAWQPDGWKPVEVAMRFFAVNTPAGPAVMPGGFGTFAARGVPGSRDRFGEKDIWVLSEQPVANFSLLAPANQPVTLSRAGGDLPSRAADNLYQLGRGVEAAEMTARLARGISLRLADQSWTDMLDLPCLFQAGGEMLFSRFAEDPENALRAIVLKKDNANGLQCVLKRIRELAIQLRDRLSEDIWSYLYNFGEWHQPDGAGAAALLPYLQSILGNCAAVAGLAAESMSRGHGWRFLEIGRRLERGLRTLNLLRHTLVRVVPEDAVQVQLLQTILEIEDCSMIYHRRYGGRLQVAPVIDLLLCDETNPRSLAYQAEHLRIEAGQLPNASNDTLLSPFDRELLRLLTNLRLADVRELAETENGSRRMLAQRIDADVAALELAAEHLSRLYLNHAPRSNRVCAMATEV